MGIHWNVGDSSFIMLSKVGEWTCCESYKGDICYKRRYPHGDAPAPVEMPDPCADPTGRVTLSMKVKGVDYLSVDALSTGVKNAIAAEAGPSILPAHVQVMQMTGGMLQVVIKPSNDEEAGKVKHTLGSSTTLVETLQDVIVAIPVPPGTDVTEVGVSDVTQPKVEAVYCGDPAVERLNGTAAGATGSENGSAVLPAASQTAPAMDTVPPGTFALAEAAAQELPPSTPAAAALAAARLAAFGPTA
jgi:hypothetical protein